MPNLQIFTSQGLITYANFGIANSNHDSESFEQQLWKAADKPRKNVYATEYKHVVLGLIFLRYISDAFENLYEKLKKGEGEYAGADPEDRDEYTAENVFFVPEKARWEYLKAQAKKTRNRQNPR